MDFKAVPISFMHNGEMVEGVLNGTWFDWEFSSQSHVFLAQFPNGILNRTIHLKGHEDPRSGIVESALSALDTAVQFHF